MLSFMIASFDIHLGIELRCSHVSHIRVSAECADWTVRGAFLFVLFVTGGMGGAGRESGDGPFG